MRISISPEACAFIRQKGGEITLTVLTVGG